MKLDKAAVARIKNATPKKQKGASSLEYIILAAAIIIIIGALTATDSGIADTVIGAFKQLFTDAGAGGGS